jgi:hypothetical protein
VVFFPSFFQFDIFFISSPTSLFSLQYLHESGLAGNGKIIGITQPRRVAATTVCHFFVRLVVLVAADGGKG